SSNRLSPQPSRRDIETGDEISRLCPCGKARNHLSIQRTARTDSTARVARFGRAARLLAGALVDVLVLHLLLVGRVLHVDHALRWARLEKPVHADHFFRRRRRLVVHVLGLGTVFAGDSLILVDVYLLRLLLYFSALV